MTTTIIMKKKKKKKKRGRRRKLRGVGGQKRGLFVCWLLNVPATG